MNFLSLFNRTCFIPSLFDIQNLICYCTVSIASKSIKSRIQLVVEVQRSEREGGHSPLSMTELIITSNLFMPSLLLSS